MPPKKHIIIIGVLSMISLGLGYWYGMPPLLPPPPPKFLKQGLVAYYPFNGNAKDESGNGEVKGASFAFDRHGNIAKGCLFDGRNDVINLDLSNVKLSDNVTISCWAKQDPDQALSAGSTRAISIGEANTGVDFKLGPSAFICVALDRKGQTISIARVRLSDGVYSANRWMLYTMTYSGGTGVVMYLNGKQIASDPIAKGVDKLLGGSFSQSSIGHAVETGHYKGSIDDVRIYNRALSEAEVKELYEFEKPKTQQASTGTPPAVAAPTPNPPKIVPNSPTGAAAIEAGMRRELIAAGSVEKVRHIDLTRKMITDVSALASLKQLEILWLPFNNLTDISALSGLTQLKRLSLENNPELIKAQIAELQKALPKCKIYSNATK